MKTKEPIEINLEGIEVHELSVFLQEGARTIPEFTASCACTVNCGNCASFSCAHCTVPPSPSASEES